jgi:hypothetical protein
LQDRLRLHKRCGTTCLLHIPRRKLLLAGGEDGAIRLHVLDGYSLSSTDTPSPGQLLGHHDAVTALILLQVSSATAGWRRSLLGDWPTLLLLLSYRCWLGQLLPPLVMPQHPNQRHCACRAGCC